MSEMVIVNQGLLNRLKTIENAKSALKNLPNVSCFDETSEDAISDYYEKPNINHYIKIIKQIGKGSYNIAEEICIVDENKNCIGDKLIMKRGEADTISCINGYYSLLFSNIVEQNLYPHFPLTINSYYCSVSDPTIIIQEKADQDLDQFLTSHLDIVETTKVLIQTFLTYFYINKVLEISTSDAKPQNVLIKNVGPTNIRYKYYDKSYCLNFNHLTLVTDFDLVERNDNTQDKMESVKFYFQSLLEGYNVDILTIRKLINLDPIRLEDLNEKERETINKFMFQREMYENCRPLASDGGEEIKRKNQNTDFCSFYFLLIQQEHNYKGYQSIKKEIHQFMKSYIINRNDFFDSLHQSFDHLIEQSNMSDDDMVEYNLEIIPTTIYNYYNHRKLSNCAMYDNFFMDKFIEKHVGFELLNDRSINEFDIEKYIDQQYDNYPIPLDKRSKTLKWFKKYVPGGYLSVDKFELYDAMRLFDYCVMKYYETIENTYQLDHDLILLAIVCLKLVSPMNYLCQDLACFDDEDDDVEVDVNTNDIEEKLQQIQDLLLYEN